jgi:hypothetical protein
MGPSAAKKSSASARPGLGHGIAESRQYRRHGNRWLACLKRCGIAGTGSVSLSGNLDWKG